MSMSMEHIRQIRAEADCLVEAETVERELARMADEITARLADNNPIVLSVMSGAMIPAGQLLSLINFPLEIDYIHASRYGEATSGGALRWYARPHLPLRGRSVLIVDDIFDEGLTLEAIVDYCRENGADEVLSAVLVKKQRQRASEMEVDFFAVEVEDRYVFGCGMDYKGYWRNLPAIYAVKGM